MAKVEPDDGHVCRGQIIDQTNPCFRSHYLILIRTGFPCRARQGDVIIANAVAHNHHGRVSGTYFERHMAGGVARGHARTDAGQYLVAIVKELHPFSHNTQSPRGPYRKGLTPAVDGVHGIRIGPIIPFGLPDIMGRVGKQGIAKIVQHPP